MGVTTGETGAGGALCCCAASALAPRVREDASTKTMGAVCRMRMLSGKPWRR
jgi:hypothetical protein